MKQLIKMAVVFVINLSLYSLILVGKAYGAELTHVANANPKTIGMAAPNILSPELKELIVVQGSAPLENPDLFFPYYGYNGDGTMLPAIGDVQTLSHNVEATKTEPDKNVYLILHNQHGADAAYNYGSHFLYQGHEGGIANPDTGRKMGYLTRISLDADGAHRVTLLATHDIQGKSIPTFDGITWNPFAQRLLLTAELGNKGGVWQATVDYPSVVEDISGALGRGGYEGIQNDSDGNIWIVEDVGGASGAKNKHARQPNSFVYRFVPKDKTNPKSGGVLQALQVMSIANPGNPIVFHSGAADADILSQDMKDLHTYGNVFKTNWVTIHDTYVDGNDPFDANALAKAKNATPFKRPENGMFRPGTEFREFFFDETGDTNALTEAIDYGGFGAIMKLEQNSPSADAGSLTMFYKCDVAHSGFDNVAFWNKNYIVFVEDAGDILHTQRNAFDSAYIFDVRVDYGASAALAPIRIMALGRDASATIDSDLSSIHGSGFQNDGDNEITGFHVSNGDPTNRGLLGAKNPYPFQNGWRIFYTQQHGDNATYEIFRTKPAKEGYNIMEFDE